MNAKPDDPSGSERAVLAATERQPAYAKPDPTRAGADLSPRPTAKSETVASRGGRPRVGARTSQYMIVPLSRGLTADAMIEQFGADVEVVRTLTAPGAAAAPVMVVRMTPERAGTLSQSGRGSLVVEPDECLRAASPPNASGSLWTGVTAAPDPGFTATLQVQSGRDEPIERAEVQIIGQQWSAQGLTGKDGKVALTLYDETPDSVKDLIVKPRSGYWGLWKRHPRLQVDAVNAVALQPLSEITAPSWGERAMRFDQIPPEYRGRDVKLALIDSGVATRHKQLGRIRYGFDAAAADGSSWSHDPSGHGTLCAGIIAATPDPSTAIHGYAPEAELHVCKLGLDARFSDLVAALDYCVKAAIDVACLGFGYPQGSSILEQRIIAAKQQGLALIAAAGSTGGPVQFPACSPHVLAVGAIGQAATFPPDTLQAAHAAAASTVGGGFFVPNFSSRGPELDLCGPGVAVISCQAPDSYAVADGTSLAAAHVAALAALVLAHHRNFQTDFALRDVWRVERLFQILKGTARVISDTALTGAGLADAPCALGLSHVAPFFTASLNASLDEMRRAIRQAGLVGAPEAAARQPPRGPAHVSHLPLSFASSATAATGMRDLRAAMQQAGLSSGP